jgi:glutamine amidotransferase-like uncharacterized protein
MTVNLYVHTDESSPTTQIWISFFSKYLPEWELRLCNAEHILDGNPDHVLFPGGSGSAFYERLGSMSANIIEWVRNGGSYIGVCAGAYLAANHLMITPLTIPDNAWERGLHEASIQMHGTEHTVNYHNGPVFTLDDNPNVEIIARYNSNFIAEDGFYEMKGTASITFNLFGNGCVSLFSPHLEKSSDEVKEELAKIFKSINHKKSITNQDEPR